MSGHGYNSICPNCGGNNLEVYSDHKPFEYITSECMDCGFYCYPQTGFMKLKDLNGRREDNDLPPLKYKDLPVRDKSVLI